MKPHVIVVQTLSDTIGITDIEHPILCYFQNLSKIHSIPSRYISNLTVVIPKKSEVGFLDFGKRLNVHNCLLPGNIPRNRCCATVYILTESRIKFAFREIPAIVTVNCQYRMVSLGGNRLTI